MEFTDTFIEDDWVIYFLMKKIIKSNFKVITNIDERMKGGKPFVRHDG